ncbi:UNVERIFIED_CONTAM: hypothetical protein NCL1_48472 [Trichonephila clavipes]
MNQIHRLLFQNERYFNHYFVICLLLVVQSLLDSNGSRIEYLAKMILQKLCTCMSVKRNLGKIIGNKMKKAPSQNKMAPSKTDNGGK